MDRSTLTIVFVVIGAAMLVWVLLPLFKAKFGVTPNDPYRDPYPDAIISGSMRSLTPDDVRAAIAADIAFPHVGQRDKLREIEIVSSNEIHLFWDFRKSESSSYDVVKRVAGKWQYIRQFTVTS